MEGCVLKLKIGIITIWDENNYGNRLQNYAVQECLKGMGVEAKTFKNFARCNNKNNTVFDNLKQRIIFLMKKIQQILKKKDNRYKNFKEFNIKNINSSSKYITGYNAITLSKDYNYFVTGSDQVFNPNFGRLTYIDLLGFIEPKKRIALAASFGIDNLSSSKQKEIKKYFDEMEAMSVREEQAKKIIKQINNKDDIEVLIDPTMMLTTSEWDKISKKPTMLKKDKYILNYFLGTLSEKRKNEINRVAKENNCEIINILDKDSPFYQCGPSEFIYLEKHAFLICTDSFHSSVFAILYNKPVVIFEREDKEEKMNSRIETLLEKFKIENRKFNGKITDENIEHNYEKAYQILEEEREKFKNFLKNSIKINSEEKIV